MCGWMGSYLYYVGEIEGVVEYFVIVVIVYEELGLLFESVCFIYGFVCVEYELNNIDVVWKYLDNVY